MNHCVISSLLCILLVFPLSGSTKTKSELIQKYLKEVIDHPSYDKRIAPNGKNGPGTAVDVNITMHFLDINTLDEQSMDFDAQFYFRQEWIDSRLQYNMTGVRKIVLQDVDKIWTPNLIFKNEKKGSLNKITQPNIYLRIEPDGYILYSIRVYEKLACKMDLRTFPHDIQKCNLTVISYGFVANEVNLAWGTIKTPVSTTKSITSFNFDIIDVSLTTNLKEYHFGNFSVLDAILTFKRNVGFFTIRMYIPFVFFVILSWISFWINPEERCLRSVLLLVVLYLMLTTTSELDRWIPYTPYSKASDSWIGCCEALVFAAFLEFLFVAVYFKRERGENSLGKTEMTSTLNNESQELNTQYVSLKAFLNHLRSGGKGSWVTNPIDGNSLFVFPICFVLFNIIYWSVYVIA